MSGRDSNPERSFRWTAIVLLAVLVLLARVPDLFYHYRDPDEANFMAQSWAMTKGQVLYKDIATFHPFLNFALMVPFFEVLRPDRVPLAIKTMNLLLIFMGALLIGRIAFEWLASRMLAFLGATLFIFYCSRHWAASSYGEFYTMFPILFSVWLLYFANRPRSPTYYLVGVLWGVAFFIKQVAAFDAIGLYIGYVCLAPTSRASKATATGFMALGFLSVAALISIYFVSHGALADAGSAMFVRPLLYAKGESYGRLGVLVFLARGIFDQLGPSILAISGVAYLALYHKDQPGAEKPKGAPFLLVLLFWFGSDLVGLLATARFASAYLIQLVPHASLLPLFILGQMEARMGKAVWISLLLPLIAVLWIDFAWEMWYLKSYNWTPPQVRTSAAVAALIDKYTRDDDGIFLYKPFNLDIFFLAQRLSNIGIYMYDEMIPKHLNDPALAERKREEFLSNLPAVIVVAPGSRNTGLDFVEDALRKDYSLKTTLDDLQIYVRTHH